MDKIVKLDYKKMTLDDMNNFIQQNKEKLVETKKNELIAFIKLSSKTDEKGQKVRQTLQCKKPFYTMVKDLVEFDNAPEKKEKKKKADATIEALENLLAELEGNK